MNKMWICIIIPIMLFSGCNNRKVANWVEDGNIDMSHEMLLSDESALTEMPEYSRIRSGESVVFQRSFENAPPMIPHRIGGFLPVTAEDNKCLRCHMPDKAPEFKAIPLPETHFTSYRPLMVEEDGVYRFDESVGEVFESDLDHFNNAFFNCSQCHVPQAEVTVEIPNVFDPEYRSSSEKSRSNLKDKMGEGVR
jgi:cytochrome c-type protein NapB